ncbi:MAG: M48 family metalloprotease [Holosporales bacterium]|jgi:predicted Zn-dependent protease|nr:M48 family metalloprotease [Holosporales bacterium]
MAKKAVWLDQVIERIEGGRHVAKVYSRIRVTDHMSAQDEKLIAEPSNFRGLVIRCIFFMCFISQPIHSEILLVVDEEIELFLEYLVNLIKDSLGYRQKINVYVSTDQTLNAMATASGDIVVNAGAILHIKDYTELIAILAHEVGHIAGHHMTKFLTVSKDMARSSLITSVLGAGAAVLTKNPAPLAAGVFAGQSMFMGQLLAKLRQIESMADTKVIEAMIKLGWFSVFHGIVGLYRKLGDHVAICNPYLSTHPMSQVRAAKFIELAEKHGKTAVSSKVKNLLERIKEKFEVMKIKLESLLFPPRDTIARYKSPAEPAQGYALAIALMRSNKYAAAIPCIGDVIAHAGEPVKPSILTPISIPHCSEIKLMCLFNLHRYQELIETFHAVQDRTRNNEVYRDITMIYALAVANYASSKKEKLSAIKALKKVLTRHPEDVWVLNMLGRLFSDIGREDHASLYAAKTAMLTGDKETAKIHAQRASSSKDRGITSQAADILSQVSDE